MEDKEQLLKHHCKTHLQYDEQDLQSPFLLRLFLSSYLVYSYDKSRTLKVIDLQYGLIFCGQLNCTGYNISVSISPFWHTFPICPKCSGIYTIFCYIADTICHFIYIKCGIFILHLYTICLLSIPEIILINPIFEQF